MAGAASPSATAGILPLREFDPLPPFLPGDTIRDQLFRPEPVVWIQRSMGEGWHGVSETVSLLGGAWGAVLALGLGLWLWGRRGLYTVLAVLLVEAVVKKALASAFSVPRPEGGGIVKHAEVEGVSSFPSGHTSSATALFAAVGLVGRIPTWAGLFLGAVVGALVGVSRLYLGVHWLPDVLAALALGAGLAWLVGRSPDAVHETLDRIPRAAWWASGLAVSMLAVAWAVTGPGPNLFAWRSVGFTAALGVAVPGERSWGGWRPGRASARRRLAATATGTLGVLLGMAAARLVSGDRHLTQAALAFAGTVWALLVVPALFSPSGTTTYPNEETTP